MTTRAFAALELDDTLKQQLAELLDRFREAVPHGSVRWVRPEGVHVTLKFYGDIDDGQVEALREALGRVAAQAAPVRLGVEGLGVFPHARRPQVIWAGLAGDLEALSALQAAVEAASAALGFAPETRAFKPHLTLGRVRHGLRPQVQMQMLQALQAAAPTTRLGEFEAAALSLMRSVLYPNGAVYTPLHVMPLGPHGEPA